MYSSAKISPPPLVENSQFKSVKNMIIRAVLDMQSQPVLSEMKANEELLSDDVCETELQQSEMQVNATSLESEQNEESTDSNDDVIMASTIFGLFVSLSHAIEDDYNRNHKKLQSKVDSKLHRMIRKHKQELGIRDDHGMTMQ